MSTHIETIVICQNNVQLPLLAVTFLATLIQTDWLELIISTISCKCICQHLMVSVSDQVSAYCSESYLLFSLPVLVPPGKVVLIVCKGLAPPNMLKYASFFFAHTSVIDCIDFDWVFPYWLGIRILACIAVFLETSIRSADQVLFYVYLTEPRHLICQEQSENMFSQN